MRIRRITALMGLLLVIVGLVSPAYAMTLAPQGEESVQEDAAQGNAGVADQGGSAMWLIITSGFAMAIASAGCGIAQARATAAAAEGMARNPGAAAPIRFALLIGLILIESLALYTFVILLIVKFV